MAFGKRFNAYMNMFPQANKPSANRCSQLPYKELKTMAKNLYNVNRNTKVELYRYMNMPQKKLANAVYHAMGAI